ncbi:magnesium transporter NIPA-domain-containing protein [Mortierella sp. GBAus27b]|nr:magnesium transporter NIPA-domain-containing protein [Mortierella sp. GBAus27b]
MTLTMQKRIRFGIFLMTTALLLGLVQIQQTTAVPTLARPGPSAVATEPSRNSNHGNKAPSSSSSSSLKSRSLHKRETPAGMPLTCSNDFDCLQSTRPANWPREHGSVEQGNYACVFPTGTSPGGTSGGGANNTTNVRGTCQFVVTAGEQCNAATDCAAFAFYTQFGLTAPTDLCSPRHCTIESTCGSPWQGSNAPTNHTFTNVKDKQISCCGGQPSGSICSLVGSNVDSCEYHNTCTFDLDDFEDNPSKNNGFTFDQMRQQGLGFCQKIDQRKHVWIGVVITLISSTVLNLGLNGQKYALRKHDEQRVRKQLEREELHERWRQELHWTEEQIQQEADRLYEEKENRRGKLYRTLKPYMFWRNIIVSKLWAAGLLVFIVGNLGGFVALRFAPQSLTAPLGSISLISNVIIAPLINKEVLGRWDLAGIFFIVGGSVMVVVFSGIVAQDYKLCVLINLFQKPATIIYLTFIGVCIIGTFFFIQFVEKNVENEADMAIGVSSERKLKRESRMYQLQSSRSSLSLVEMERRATSKELDSEQIRKSIEMSSGIGLNPNASHTSGVGASTTTSVEAGPSTSSHQPPQQLRFADSVSPSKASEAAGAIAHSRSSTSSYRTTQRRRRGSHSSRHDYGATPTAWERIKRIELIPSLPEDKLIQRNSPLLRFCLPLAYASLGGMMASYTVLFAKSLINLLVTSIFEGDNQFKSVIAWVILIVTVVTAVSQVYWINMGLKKYDALLQVPVFFTIWVLLDIVGGGIYYDEFRGFSTKQFVLFSLGVLIVFFGVALLAKRLALLAKEDVGESPSQSQAASAVASRRHSVTKGEGASLDRDNAAPSQQPAGTVA